MAEVKEKPSTDTVPEKKELPLDIFSDAMPTSEDLPLDGAVVEKEYAVASEEVRPPTGGGTTTPPPPPITNADGTTQAPVAPPVAGVTAEPARTPEQIQSEAAQLVDMLLKGYEKLHGLGRWAGKVDETELVQEHMSGKIDLNTELPLGRKSITVKEFFHEYNASIDENIVVDDEFKEKIKPPLIRIAIKRGWALGDEMYVGMLLGEDLATKASMLIGLKKSANLVLKACHDLMKKKNGAADLKEEREEKHDKADEKNTEDVPFTETKIDESDSWREESEQP